jgi:hypothetical protein
VSNTVYTKHSTMTQSPTGEGRLRDGKGFQGSKSCHLAEGAQRLRSATCILISSAMDCPDVIHDLVEKAYLVRLPMTIPTIRERERETVKTK